MKVQRYEYYKLVRENLELPTPLHPKEAKYRRREHKEKIRQLEGKLARLQEK